MDEFDWKRMETIVPAQLAPTKPPGMYRYKRAMRAVRMQGLKQRFFRAMLRGVNRKRKEV